MTLETQVAGLREQLNALRREVIRVSEVAGEQDQDGVVDDLSDALRFLNDATSVLADVIVEGSTDTASSTE